MKKILQPWEKKIPANFKRNYTRVMEGRVMLNDILVFKRRSLFRNKTVYANGLIGVLLESIPEVEVYTPKKISSVTTNQIQTCSKKKSKN